MAFEGLKKFFQKVAKPKKEVPAEWKDVADRGTYLKFREEKDAEMLEELKRRRAEEREAREQRQMEYKIRQKLVEEKRTIAKQSAGRLAPAIFRRKASMPRPFIKGMEHITGMPAKKPKTGGKGRVGRPRGSYKYFIPGKGPVPVSVYKKWLRSQKIMSQMAVQRQMARQVVPQYPQTREMPPQATQMPYRAVPQQRAYPPSAIQQQMPVQPSPESDYYVYTDLMTGRKSLKRRPQREAWTY